MPPAASLDPVLASTAAVNPSSRPHRLRRAATPLRRRELAAPLQCKLPRATQKLRHGPVNLSKPSAPNLRHCIAGIWVRTLPRVSFAAVAIPRRRRPPCLANPWICFTGTSHVDLWSPGARTPSATTPPRTPTLRRRSPLTPPPLHGCSTRFRAPVSTSRAPDPFTLDFNP